MILHAVSGAMPPPHGIGIGVARTAVLTTGVAGVYVQIPWDTLLANPETISFSLVGGDLVCDAGARFCIEASVQIVTGVLGLTGSGLRLLLDGVALKRDEESGLGVAIGGAVSRAIITMVDLAPGQVLRAEVASFGIGAVPVALASDVTSMRVSAI